MKNILNSFSGLLKKSAFVLGMMTVSFAGFTAYAANNSSSIDEGSIVISDPISGSHTAPFDFACDTNPLYNPVTISGSATAVAPPGNLDQYHVGIDWGDGNTSDAVELSSFGTGKGTSTQNFSAEHSYTDTGAHPITISIYHVNGQGQDNTVDALITIPTCVHVPPPTSGTVILEKVVTDEVAPASNFAPFKIGDTEVTLDIPTDIPAGVHSVTESNASAYDATYSEDCANGSINIVAGMVYNCTITNTLKPAVSHTVTFDANTGTGTMAPESSSVPAALTSNTFTKTGFIFGGWNTQSDGNGSSYADGATYDFASNITLYAVWTLIPPTTYTITVTQGDHGTISPDTQTGIAAGADQAFTISPDAHYHIVDVVVDGASQGPITDYNFLNINAGHAITASFAADQVTLTYVPGEHGSLNGDDSQTIDYGTDGTPVEAVPDTGYHFVKWAEDDSIVNPRTDTNVTVDATYTAVFEATTHTLTYTADANGTISGDAVQVVNEGEDGTTVTAVPNAGFAFVKWDDDSTDNPRTDTNVTGDITVQAIFAALPACSDGLDNDEDNLVDSADPGCHSDGHADNPDSYNPEDGSEADRGSDVALTKTVDDSTPDANQNIVYTLTATNNGPDFAASVVVTDVLPAGATYVSDDGAGAYDNGTGEWTVGSLANGASATLHITVKATASAGNSVTNTATALVSNEEDLGDPYTDDNTSSVTFTVNKPVHHGGGGGGSGCPAGTHFDTTSLTCVPDGQVLGASTGQVLGVSCGLYMDQHLRRGGAKNNPDQVTKLQAFLNKHGFGTFTPTGFFGPLTEAAVKAFQAKYADQILTPWNLTSPTGLAYLTTIRELNLIECPDLTIAVPELVPWSQNPNAQ